MNEHLLKKNRKRFKELNITKWQEAGYTGKGIKIVILGVGEDAHHNGEWLMQSVAKNADIIELDCMHGSWEEALETSIEIEADIICSSLVKGSWPDKLEELSHKLYEKGCIMIDSADNHGKEICRWPALSKYWFVAGSYDEDEKDREGYSNFGAKLDFLMFTNFANKNKKGNYITISHTSGSTQVPSGMVALLKEYYGSSDFGPSEFEEVLKKYSIDLQKEGFDINTGHGLFILPEKLPEKEVEIMNKPCKIIIHHSLTKDGDVVDYDAMKRYHVNKKGWRDIGYHYVIEKVGDSYKIIKGRDEKMIGAHTKGENANSIGICLVGNFDIAPPTKEQLEKLYELLQDIFKRHGMLPIFGHCNFPDPKTGHRKTCPGTKFPMEEVIENMEGNKNVEISEWAKEAHAWVVSEDISDGTRPKDFVTREEMWTMLYRLNKKGAL